VALIYQYRGRALEARGEHAAAIEALRGSLDACGVVLVNHVDGTCRHVVWMVRVLLAQALVSVGDTAAGLKESEDALEGTTHPVHMILAKRSTGEERVAEWRAAAGYYKRAVVEWRTFPNWRQEPFLDEMRQAGAALAESERAVK
jgi:hypothetical protein